MQTILNSFNYTCVVLFFPFWIVGTSPALGDKCSQGEIACDWLSKVVVVRTLDVTASAVRLNNEFFVTNKHVVEDNLSVQIQDSNGLVLDASVLPNRHNSDLVLLSLNKNSKLLPTQLEIPTNFEGLRGVAYGIGRGKIRIFPEGKLISSSPKVFKQARIHSTIRNLPGISGGALINSSGELVGILAAGSGKYNEAIPLQMLNEVITETGHSSQEFLDRGRAFKLCSNQLLYLEKLSISPPDNFLAELQRNCDKANNKTLFDLLGQTFGRFGLVDHSIKYLRKSVALDPNSPTSLVSLAIALQFNRLYKEQVEVLDHLLEFVQDDPLVLRMSVQAAAFSKDKIFAKKALKFLKINNPYAYPQAADFIKEYIYSM